MAENKPSNTSDKLEFEYMDVKALLNCSSLIRVGLDKAVQKGCFSLDETEKLLVSLNSLTKSVESLDKYQTFVVNKIKETQEKEQTNTETKDKKSTKRKVVYEDDIAEN